MAVNVVYLAAGAAGFYCGACARDVALARGLMARGHRVLLLPLYTPLQVDGPDPSVRRIFYSGISAYLEQKSPMFRKRLPVVDRLFDSTLLLRAVSHFAIDTQPGDLGAMTVSVLRGPSGRQAKELWRLVEFLESEGRPDIVNLTNSLLSGVAGAIKERLDSRIVCTLQGEEWFLEHLPRKHRDEAWALLRRNVASVDLFVAPHRAYADEMATLFGVPRERFRVIPPGVDTAMFRPTEGRESERASEVVTIGCLSRIAPEKGQDLLCEAFANVAKKVPGRVRLRIAGQQGGGGKGWRREMEDLLAARGLSEQVAFEGELDLEGKLRFLREVDIFAQGSRLPEQRGMAPLEAMASGAAVVAPRSGIFPEVVERSGGGVLYRPEDVEELTEAMVRLVEDGEGRRRMGRAARAGIEAHYSAAIMTEGTLAAYGELLGQGTE